MSHVKRSNLTPWLGAGCCLATLLACGRPALAHADSPASPPLVPSSLKLENASSDRIVALFSREHLPGVTERMPRTARVDETESLVPYGAEAILRSRDNREVILIGTEAVPELRACIQALDAPLVAVAPNRNRIVLTLKPGKLAALRASVLRLPGAGTAILQGARITLEGSPEWVFRAERQVIRARFGLPLAR